MKSVLINPRHTLILTAFIQIKKDRRFYRSSNSSHKL
uniref:Uncharacterized protein n=1 Tax=Rhizophora mucronata TaxID=61149 RepID=A0A2P2NRY3_RHIMU